MNLRYTAVLSFLAAQLVATAAHGHTGRRLEVIVNDGRLAVHGYNTGPDDTGGSPRSYLNALHGVWENEFGVIALADLPGFDVFSQAASVVGAGAAEALAGGDLTLALRSYAEWLSPSADDPFAAPQLTSYATQGPINSDDLTISGETAMDVVSSIGDDLTLAASIPAAGKEDIDLDFTIGATPTNKLHVLEWTLSTTTAGVESSNSVFLIFAPDPAGGDFTEQALMLERYLGEPLAPGDFDRSGEVDATDYAYWRRQYGERPLYAGAGADANHDGLVDAADYAVWRNHLPTAIAEAVAAPEPRTLLLLASLAFLALGARTSPAG